MDPSPSDNPAAAQRLLHGLTRSELTAWLETIGQSKFRASQIWRWLYIKGSREWAEMKNISAELRARLASEFSLESVAVLQEEGTVESTCKALLALRDGERVEEVLIPAPGRRTVCVSSQAGCRFHCAFCASGQGGFRRNLETGEIVGQVPAALRYWGERPTHVVFMGVGEPFDNYDAVLKAVRIINDADGLAIGARRITLSTNGVIPGIERLSGEGLQVELSVSLHAADDALRSELMPINRLYPLGDLIPVCRAYVEKTGRIITFEYTLIQGVNDSVKQAAELARLSGQLPCRVNLIPLSPVEEYPGRASSPEVAARFIETLRNAGINATLRASRGASVKAACGQLRSRYEKGSGQKTEVSGQKSE